MDDWGFGDSPEQKPQAPRMGIKKVNPQLEDSDIEEDDEILNASHDKSNNNNKKQDVPPTAGFDNLNILDDFDLEEHDNINTGNEKKKPSANDETDLLDSHDIDKAGDVAGDDDNWGW